MEGQGVHAPVLLKVLPRNGRRVMSLAYACQEQGACEREILS